MPTCVGCDLAICSLRRLLKAVGEASWTSWIFMGCEQGFAKFGVAKF